MMGADVMRGEEVQLLCAAVAGLVPPEALLCQPRTHCNWVLVRRHSVLRPQLDGATEPDAAFRAGVQLAEAGGTLIIAPNTNLALIAAAAERGLVPIPGFATPSEAFAAIDAGAAALKLFPAEAATPRVLQAMRAVLPKDMPVLPVGGITPESCGAWLAAGAAGFGLGSALYKPGMDAQEVGQRARAFIAALAGD